MSVEGTPLVHLAERLSRRTGRTPPALESRPRTPAAIDALNEFCQRDSLRLPEAPPVPPSPELVVQHAILRELRDLNRNVRALLGKLG